MLGGKRPRTTGPRPFRLTESRLVTQHIVFNHPDLVSSGKTVFEWGEVLYNQFYVIYCQ